MGECLIFIDFAMLFGACMALFVSKRIVVMIGARAQLQLVHIVRSRSSYLVQNKMKLGEGLYFVCFLVSLLLCYHYCVFSIS